MRKLASLSIAIVASFALAGAASATLTASITGPNTPGTNTYSILISFATGDNIQGYAVSVDTTGTYTGVFTRTATAPFSDAGIVVLNPPTTGVGSFWGAVTGGINATGGTYTIGTVQINTVGGTTILPHFRVGLDGFLINGTTTQIPTAGNITGVTVIPEPTTASLLALGIVGLVLAGRKRRA